MLKFIKSDRFFIGMYVLILVLGLGSHFATVVFSPLPWLDEVEILEIARGGIVHPANAWSMHFLSTDALNAQAWALYYVGGWIQNLLYNLFGFLGPRVMNILALLALSFAGYYYTWRRTASRKIASLMGIIFFACPVFVQSARGDRVDNYTVLICFAILLLIDFCKARALNSNRIVAFLCGCLMMLSFFTWITAIFFAPIYLWAILYLDEDHKMRNIIFCALGALTTMAVLLTPFYSTIVQSADALSSAVYSGSGASNAELKITSAMKGFFSFLIGFPFVALVGMIMLFFSKRMRLVQMGVLLFFVVCVLIGKRIYAFRLLYLIPFALLGIVAWCATHNAHRKIVLMVLALLAGCCFLRGIVLRNGIEYLAKEGRNPASMIATLEQKIGRNVPIYNGTHQLYFIGRDLGWRQFCDAAEHNGSQFDFKAHGIKYYINEEREISPDAEAHLLESGFVRAFDIQSEVTNNWKTKFLKKAGKVVAYGPYRVYKRHD